MINQENVNAVVEARRRWSITGGIGGEEPIEQSNRSDSLVPRIVGVLRRYDAQSPASQKAQRMEGIIASSRK